jgi:hypothetical protein
VLSQALDGDTRQPASLSWITSALSLPTPPPPPPPARADETATGAGTQWPGTSNWFMYTKFSASKVDLIAGQHHDAGDITMRNLSKTSTEITITLQNGFDFAGAQSNLKIHPMSRPPLDYVQPGAFTHKFTVSGQTVKVTVPTAAFYGIHADVLGPLK